MDILEEGILIILFLRSPLSLSLSLDPSLVVFV
jgi:hypothetical protein